MDLNDELTPREHSDLRDRVTGGVGRMRAARARRSRIVAGAAAVALVGVVVSGVAFAALRPDGRTAHPVETTTVAPTPQASSSSPTPTPDPEPEAESPRTAPTLPFGGDCTQILDRDALSAVVGVELGDPVDLSTPEVRTIGGLDCAWTSPTWETVGVYVLPVDVVPADVADAYAATVCEAFKYDNVGCRRAVSDDSTWMLVTVSGVFGDADGLDDEVMSARLDAVLPLFAAALPGAGSPEPAERTSSWWPPTTCVDLASRVSVADILGTSDFVEGYPSAFGTDVHIEIARDAGLGTVCRWYAPNSTALDAVIVTLYPGGAWEWDRLAAGDGRQDVPAPVDVNAALHAVRGVGAVLPDSSYLLATDGVNVVEILEAPDVVDAAERVLDAMRSGM